MIVEQRDWQWCCMIGYEYKSVCWRCRDEITSELCKRCPVCGWFYCNKCGACAPNCLEYLQPERLELLKCLEQKRLEQIRLKLEEQERQERFKQKRMELKKKEEQECIERKLRDLERLDQNRTKAEKYERINRERLIRKFRPGNIVEHKVFGVGTVVKVSGGWFHVTFTATKSQRRFRLCTSILLDFK